METQVQTPEDIAKAHIAKTQEAKVTAKAEEAKVAKEKEAEAKGAVEGSSPEEKKPEVKSKSDDVVGDAEQTVKDNIRILETKEVDLNDEDKAKRKELMTKQAAKKAEAEEKEGKSNVEKRIGELTGKVKDLKREGTSDKETIGKLQVQIDELQKDANATPEQKAQEERKKVDDERIAKYLDEDKDLPKEKRREMTRDDLEEWLLEDMVSAQEWMTDRTIRRREEAREEKTRGETKAKATEVIKQQEESNKRVAEKYPALAEGKERRKALTDAGKTQEEADRIIFQENPTVRALASVLKTMKPEDHDAMLIDPAGPENLMKKVDAVLNKREKREDTDTEERDRKIAEEAIEAERQRMADIDVTKNSTRNGTPEVEQTDAYKQQLALAKKAGISKERLDKRLAQRKKISGL